MAAPYQPGDGVDFGGTSDPNATNQTNEVDFMEQFENDLHNNFWGNGNSMDVNNLFNPVETSAATAQLNNQQARISVNTSSISAPVSPPNFDFYFDPLGGEELLGAAGQQNDQHPQGMVGTGDNTKTVNHHFNAQRPSGATAQQNFDHPQDSMNTGSNLSNNESAQFNFHFDDDGQELFGTSAQENNHQFQNSVGTGYNTMMVNGRANAQNPSGATAPQYLPQFGGLVNTNPQGTMGNLPGFNYQYNGLGPSGATAPQYVPQPQQLMNTSPQETTGNFPVFNSQYNGMGPSRATAPQHVPQPQQLVNLSAQYFNTPGMNNSFGPPAFGNLMTVATVNGAAENVALLPNHTTSNSERRVPEVAPGASNIPDQALPPTISDNASNTSRPFIADITSFEDAERVRNSIYKKGLKRVKVPANDDHEQVSGILMMRFQERLYNALYIKDVSLVKRLERGEDEYLAKQQDNGLAKVLKKTATESEQQLARANCCKLLSYAVMTHTDGGPPLEIDEDMTCSDRVELIIKAVGLKTVALDVIKGETAVLREIAAGPLKYVKKKRTLLQSNHIRLKKKEEMESRANAVSSNDSDDELDEEYRPKRKDRGNGKGAQSSSKRRKNNN